VKSACNHTAQLKIKKQKEEEEHILHQTLQITF